MTDDTDARDLARLVLAARKARHAHITSDDDMYMDGPTWAAWYDAQKAAEDKAEAMLGQDADHVDD